ncbi:tumor protein p53-inducible nuclear protein 2 [Centroberyx gerrardi]|uniref:tumor protein p53-inducible nuclear protein 2 n=1 Tax=Centroberyx gerrardi TaxID=166262 RepID=UPI003AAAAE0E
MLRTIARLLFGGEEETPEDVKSGEVVEEDWLLVSHQEAINEVSSAEDQDAELADTRPSNPAVHEDTDANLETAIRMLEREPSVQSSSTTSQVISSSSVSHAEALAKVTQVTRVQRAQAWVERHHLSRNAIQRQNCARQRSQHHTHNTYLHQPGHRNPSH